MADVDDLCWGVLPFRSRVNTIADALSILGSAGENVSEFLCFDAKSNPKRLLLCRYTEGEHQQVRVLEIRHPELPAVSLDVQPRQLVLCSTQRLFASLSLRSGNAEVAIWELGADSYQPVARVDGQIAGVHTARAIAWLGTEAQPYWSGGSSNSAVLALLLADASLLVEVRRENPRGSWQLQELIRLSVKGRPISFCWSRTGSRLLVGGHGQMTCFAWAAAPSVERAPPEVRHLLCAGNCAEIRPCYNSAFVCRVDQLDPPNETVVMGQTPLLAGSLAMPNGQQLQSPSIQRQLVVEVASNPQDGPPETDVAAPNFTNVSSLTSHGLSIVPRQRFLVPFSCEKSSSASVGEWKVRCGPHLEVSGEMLDTAPAQRWEHVAVGSFDRDAKAAVWKLAQPHRWQGDRAAWQQVTVIDLTSEANAFQIRGLSLWPVASEGISLHMMLEESTNERPLFGQSAPRRMYHRCLAVSEHGSPCCEPAAPSSSTSSSINKHQPPGEDVPQDGEIRRREEPSKLDQIAESVAGMRTELRSLNEGFAEFRGDFRRLIVAIEALAGHKTEAASTRTANG